MSQDLCLLVLLGHLFPVIFLSLLKVIDYSLKTKLEKHKVNLYILPGIFGCISQ